MNIDFRKRLFQFEVQPPLASWDRITAALDETVRSFPEKLVMYEEAPAPGLWTKISSEIDAVGTGKVVPFRMKRMVRYGSVAAGILLAVVGFFLVNESNNTITAEPERTVRQQPLQNNNQQPVAPGSQATNELAVQNAAGAEVPVKRRISISGLAASKVARPAAYRPERNLNVTQQVPPLQEKKMVNTTWAERYMIATSNSGTVVRLPKKAYAAFACVEPADLACKEKMVSMQNKLATASVTTDFAGFLDLLNNLEDNH